MAVNRTNEDKLAGIPSPFPYTIKSFTANTNHPTLANMGNT